MLPISPVHRTALGALAVVSALGLAGCSGGSSEPAGTAAPPTEGAGTVAAAPSAETTADGSGTSPTPGPTTADGAGTADGPTASDGAEDRPTPNPATGAENPGPRDGSATGGGLCATSQLELAVAPAGAGTGSVFLELTATNASGVPCTIAGYPGVSFVDARGTMIGVPAVRAPAAPGTAQLLAPGESATAMLRMARAAMYPACDPRPAEGLRVYPPESTEPAVVAHPVQACANPAVQQLEIQGFGT